MNVDGDDFAGSRELRAQDGVQSHAAEPNDGDARAGGDLGSIDDGSDAREDGATEKRGLFKGQVEWDLHGRATIDDGVFGKGRDPDVVVDALAVLVEAEVASQKAAGGVGLLAGFAEPWAALNAGATAATAGRENHDDVVAGGQIRDAGAAFDHLAGGFVAEDHGHAAGAVRIDGGEVGVAEAGGADADE